MKESESKTKIVGVIWFGEVPVDKCENPIISDEMTGYVYDQVELMDEDKVGIEAFVGGNGDDYISYTISAPPPKQETVEDVLKDMLRHFREGGYTRDSIGNKGCRDAYERFIRRIEAAQEREDNK